MAVAADASVYHLIIHGQIEKATFIFVGRDPALDGYEGISTVAVTLELLPPRQRFGSAGGVAMGLPVLGRWPGGVNRFRQFLTISELEQANWVLVPNYRICDTWVDYQSPWSFAAESASDASPSLGLTQTCDACDTGDSHERFGADSQADDHSKQPIPEINHKPIRQRKVS